MTIHFKIGNDLVEAVRTDLHRAHPFAYERVGFLFAGVAAPGGDLIVTASDYRPVADEDYLDDSNVGAMMGPDAIRKALQHSYQTRTAAIHVHLHVHRGRPNFSGVDNRENAKFVPNFFNVSPQRPHGAIVLSEDAMRGHIWLHRDARPVPIGRFSVVGAPLWFDGEAA
ncbi:hypothetical protein [Sphingopyxis sp. H115]|jgi:hypothetical protein|uniref:hypothetical protein n=1 Tax=Sphingopyxis sp. H115 TaxID=1759073 RepID=UPI00073716CD|nr:hypothetical protein [Sphingopyxis sp. H115]KTE01918.1 hypothetical protein ATE71_20465 [Sphingopyxis sp. H115]MDZ4369278.1 hypothetical protein [Afipia sp.]